MMIVFWLVVIAVVVWLVLYLRPHLATGTTRQGAEGLLAERGDSR